MTTIDCINPNAGVDNEYCPCDRHQAKDTHADRNSTSHAHITLDNCMDCAGEREQYGAMYCPIHYQTAVDVGDSLYNKIDNKMYLVLMVDYKRKTITLTDTSDNKFNIGTDERTLSNFKLIKSQD